MATNRLSLSKQLEKSITQGSIPVTNGSNELGYLIPGTSGQILTSTGTTVNFQDPVFWGLSGNAGTSMATNFVGTTDLQPLLLKSNNTELFRINSTATSKTITTTGSTIDTPLVLSNFTVNSVLGTASTTVDLYSTIIIPQTTPNISLFINNPTTIAAGRKLTIVNSGTAHFWIRGGGTSLGIEVPAKSSTEFIHDGITWIPSERGGTEFWGTIRNTGGTWALINDANHEPHNLTNVITSPTNYAVSVDNQLSTEQVGTSIVTVDETYTEYGISAGATQGVSTTSIKVAKKGFGVYISWNGSAWTASTETWNIVNSSDFTFSFSGAGVLTVTHSGIVITHDTFAISATGRNGINVQLDSVTTTSFSLVFRNPITGAILTTPTTACRAFINHCGMWEPSPAKLAITSPNPSGNANIWIYGKFKN